MSKRLLVCLVTLALLIGTVSGLTVAAETSTVGRVDFRSGTAVESGGISAAVNVVGITTGTNPTSYYAADFDTNPNVLELVVGRRVTDAVKIDTTSITGGVSTQMNVYVKYYFNSNAVYFSNHAYTWLAVDSAEKAAANSASSQYIRVNADAGPGWPGTWVGRMAADAWTWQKFTLNTTGNITIGAGDNVGLFALQQIMVCKTADAEAAEALITADIAADEEANRVDGVKDLDLTLYGRTSYDQNNGLVLFWTNSGFAFRFNGTGATADFTVNNIAAGREGHLNVYVDGEFSPSKTIKLTTSPMNGVVLAEGLPAGEHTIEVRKRNEAAYGGSATVTVNKLSVTDGEFLSAPAAPSRVIEFVGDSITCGFGNLESGSAFSTDSEDGTMTYAVLAAKALGANASVVSRGGIGYAKSAGNSDTNIIPHYSKVSTLPGVTVCGDNWDFENHKSDVVVINLGTNDSRTDATETLLTEKAVELLTLVREKNPDATIIWAYGMMGVGRAMSCIQAAIESLDDDNMYLLRMEPMNASKEGVGRDGHPTVQTHINRSVDLARFIAEKMGWEVDGSAALQAQMQWTNSQISDAMLANYADVTVNKLKNLLTAGEQMVASGTADLDDYIGTTKAIFDAYLGLLSKEECGSEYTVIDTFDNIDGISFTDGVGSLDSTNQIEGTGCASSTGMEYTVAINRHGAYNVPLPTNCSGWYIECWMYVDDASKITDKCYISVIENSETVGMQWDLQDMDLQNGWNKLYLPLAGKSASFTTIKGVYLSFRPMLEPITIKLDYLVLAKGRLAADITALQAVLNEAEQKLADKDDAVLRAAYEHAQSVLSQADVDAAVARLRSIMDVSIPSLGDVDGDGDVDSTDARLTLQYYVEAIGADALHLDLADVDGDGDVDSTDARLILQHYVGSIAEFPAEK